MTRTIEVSHWGNIAVEETYHMKHVGAELQVTVLIPSLICDSSLKKYYKYSVYMYLQSAKEMDFQITNEQDGPIVLVPRLFSVALLHLANKTA